jgi:hypothetical protein
MLFRAAVAILVGGLVISIGSSVAAGVEQYQSMVMVATVVQFYTEGELADMRRRSQANLAMKKQTMTPGTVITDQEVLALSREYLLNASRRLQFSPPEMQAQAQQVAEREVQQWFKQSSPPTPQDVYTDLRMRFYALYTEEELRVIAQSPRCVAAVQAGNLPTSAEVRQWSSQ